MPPPLAVCIAINWYEPLPTASTTDRPPDPALAFLTPLAPGTKLPPRHTATIALLVPSVTVARNAETPPGVGTTTRARAFGGIVAHRVYRPLCDDDHDELTSPIGVLMLALAHVKLLSAPGAGGAIMRSRHERLPGARWRPARVE